MKTKTVLRTVTVMGAAALVALAVACTSGDAGGNEPSPTPPEPGVADCSANTAGRAPAGGRLVWADVLPDGEIPAPDGWTVRSGEGEAPLLSVFNGDTFAGWVELLDYPIESIIAPDGGIEALEAHIEQFLAEQKVERQAEYNGEYDFEADEIEHVSLGEFCALRVGYSGTSPDGTELERYSAYFTFDQENVYLFTALYDVAYGGEMGWTDAGSLRQYEPYMAELMESLTLPA